MTILAIANQKGGVGKTTTTHNLGYALTEEGKDVLLLDMDHRADLTTCLGFSPEKLEKTVYDLMYRAIRSKPGPEVDEVILETSFGAHLIPSNDNLSGAQADLLTAVAGDSILRQVLAATRNKYDYVLIDTPADLNLLTVNALVAADRVLIPIQTEFLAAKGSRKLLETIAVVRERLNPQLEIDGLLLTMTARTVISREIAELTHKTFNQRLPVYQTTIRRRVALASAQRKSKTIFEYRPRSDSVEDYRNLAKEVIGHAQS